MTHLLPGSTQPQPPPRPSLFATVSFQDVLALALFVAGIVLYWYADDGLFLFLAGYGLGRLRFARASR